MWKCGLTHMCNRTPDAVSLDNYSHNHNLAMTCIKITTSHFALNSLRRILYPDLQTTRKYKTTLEDDKSLFYALKMHTLVYRRLHIKSFGRTRPRFNNKYCGSAFLFFLTCVECFNLIFTRLYFITFLFLLVSRNLHQRSKGRRR